VPASWNHLVQALKTDYVILLNNDMLVFQKWFETMKFFLENNPNTGTVSLPTILIDKHDISRTMRNPDNRSVEILDPATRIKRPGIFNLPESKPPIRVISPIGCSFGFRRDKFDMIGGFDEGYRAFYEELDFGIRLYNRGFPSVILPGPHLYHLWGATFQRNQHIDSIKIMENSRNTFISKHGEDKMNIFKKLNHNFETPISYLDINDNTQKTITLKETYPPDSDMGW
jgi:GT2 family glycosyltransferase